MTIVEIKAGPLTHRYLMKKSKSDLASMFIEYAKLTNNDGWSRFTHAELTAKHTGYTCDQLATRILIMARELPVDA